MERIRSARRITKAAMKKDVSDVCSSSSSSSDEQEGLNLTADDGWEDAEADDEGLVFFSLLDDEEFHSLGEMLDHCKRKHGFDFLSISNELGG